MVEIQHYFHKDHRLTFCESDGGELVRCPGCCDPSFNVYGCSKCRFRTYWCTACGEKPSGSFYICKICWPASPLFHKSCVDITQEIRITSHPHCTLRFEEGSKSPGWICNFCNRYHQGYKFCCEVCDFMIGFGCAAKLIKYLEREKFEHFSHRHQLTSLLEVVEDQLVRCELCYKKIDGPCYGCAPCKFYIHNACRQFLREIRLSFHPPHSLTQIIDDKTYLCDACCLHFRGFRYRCSICNFNLHPECASLKANVKYSGHALLLTLFEYMSCNSICHACGFKIQRVSYLRCVQCDLDFHVQCDCLQLPSTIVLKQHQHHLALSTETLVKNVSCSISCNTCKKEIKLEHLFYCCVDCEYFAHMYCAVTEIQLNEKGKMRHISHPHILTLHENQMNDDIFCYGCWKAIKGLVYGCDPCKYYLHKWCMELPRQIFHYSHQHFLTLKRSSILPKHNCDCCGKLQNGFAYHCKGCNFNLDLDCASQHPAINLIACSTEYKYLESEEKIGHFSQHHPLIISEVINVGCRLCYKSIHGQSYGCDLCKFFIHKQCGNVLPEIHHPFQPRHSLQLQIFEYPYNCDACLLGGQGIRYQCDNCHFILHPECSWLMPKIKYTGHQEHLLILVENMSYESQCEECGFENHGTFFLRCVECNMDFHVQGGPLPLPQTIMHKGHEHALALSAKNIVNNDSHLLSCDVCQNERSAEHIAYFCAACKYYAHVRCAITEMQINERENLRHFSHQHLLFLLENKRNDGIACRACEKGFQTDPAYGCDKCKFYLHKSCAELPSERQHPFHRHSLCLRRPFDRKVTKCKACLKYCDGFPYSCEDCDFHMDLDCGSLFPSIKFESHEHHLTYFKKLHDTPICKSCTSDHPDKFIPLKESYFRCVKCDFNVHMFCSPLPQTITHDCHWHVLTLKDNVADLVDRSCDGDYYCDICENKRDAREFVYYCGKCNFVVDIDCVIVELIHSLEGKRGDVQLRIVGQKDSTFDDVIKSLTKEELMMKDHLTLETDEELKQVMEDGKEANLRIAKLFSDLDKSLVELMARSYKVRLSQGLDVVEDDFDQRIVNVGDYKIISKYALLLQYLLDKYGDIGVSSTLTQSLKTVFLVIFCDILDSMRNTKFIDVDVDLINKWWTYLELVHRAGFSIDFAFDHLKRTAHARFVRGAILNISSRSLYLLHEEIAKQQEDITKLYMKIDERKAEVQKLKERVQNDISGHATEQWRSEAKSSSEAMESLWNKIGLP